MSKSGTIFLGAAGVLFAVTAIAASAPKITLHVNLGLWEITSRAKISGAPMYPPSMLAQLPPARRAAVMAAMDRSMAKAAEAHVGHSCVTAADLDKPFKMGSEGRMKCDYAVISSTASEQQVQATCSRDKSTTNGMFHFRAPTPSRMVGTMDMAITEEGHTTNMKMDLTGRWLGADCGKIKPGHGETAH